MRFNQSYDQEVRLLSGLELPSKAELDSLSVLYHAFGTRRRRQLKSFKIAIGAFYDQDNSRIDCHVVA